MFYEFLQTIYNAKQMLWRLPYQISSQKVLKDYLSGHLRTVCLNIGSGSQLLPGWLNADLHPIKGGVYLDATKPLPFPDDSIDFINCEHFIEHLEHKDGIGFFNECFRTLKNEGILRLSTPSLEKLIGLYQGHSMLPHNKLIMHHQHLHNPSIDNICEWFNDHLRLWGHKFIYDEATLLSSLNKAGFSVVEKVEYGKSIHPELQDIEKHDEGVEWMKWGYIMIFEACKK